MRYYVYELRYPDDRRVFGLLAGRVFYVGKGTGNRVDAHEKETRAILKRGNAMLLSAKHKTILWIWDNGYQVGKSFPLRTDNEDEAFAVESALIKQYGLEYLTNETYGHGPRAQRRLLLKNPHP